MRRNPSRPAFRRRVGTKCRAAASQGQAHAVPKREFTAIFPICRAILMRSLDTASSKRVMGGRPVELSPDITPMILTTPLSGLLAALTVVVATAAVAQTEPTPKRGGALDFAF